MVQRGYESYKKIIIPHFDMVNKTIKTEHSTIAGFARSIGIESKYVYRAMKDLGIKTPSQTKIENTLKVFKESKDEVEAAKKLNMSPRAVYQTNRRHGSAKDFSNKRRNAAFEKKYTESAHLLNSNRYSYSEFLLESNMKLSTMYKIIDTFDIKIKLNGRLIKCKVDKFKNVIGDRHINILRYIINNNHTIDNNISLGKLAVKFNVTVNDIENILNCIGIHSYRKDLIDMKLFIETKYTSEIDKIEVLDNILKGKLKWSNSGGKR